MGKGLEIVNEIEEALAPVLAAEGYELVLLELGGGVMRVFIDHLDEGVGGVTLDDCTRVTHLVSDFLDAEGFSDRIPGRYTLEVSSPGLDRPLVRPEHFRKFVGREAQVVVRREQQPEFEGRRKLTGPLVRADVEQGGGIELDVDGQSRAIAYDAIERARLVPDL